MDHPQAVLHMCSRKESQKPPPSLSKTRTSKTRSAAMTLGSEKHDAIPHQESRRGRIGRKMRQRHEAWSAARSAVLWQISRRAQASKLRAPDLSTEWSAAPIAKMPRSGGAATAGMRVRPISCASQLAKVAGLGLQSEMMSCIEP